MEKSVRKPQKSVKGLCLKKSNIKIKKIARRDILHPLRPIFLVLYELGVSWFSQLIGHLEVKHDFGTDRIDSSESSQLSRANI